MVLLRGFVILLGFLKEEPLSSQFKPKCFRCFNCVVFNPPLARHPGRGFGAQSNESSLQAGFVPHPAGQQPPRIPGAGASRGSQAAPTGQEYPVTLQE